MRGKIHHLLLCSPPWIDKPFPSWNSELGWFVSRSWSFFFFSSSNLPSWRGKEKKSFFFILHFQYLTPNFLHDILIWSPDQKPWIHLPSPWKWTLFKLSIFENSVNVLGLKAQNLWLTFDSPSRVKFYYTNFLPWLIIFRSSLSYFSKTLSLLFPHISQTSLLLAESANSPYQTLLIHQLIHC